VPKNILTKVDANADLVLRFEVAKAKEIVASPEWQLLNKFLETFKELAAKRAQLMEAKIDPADQNQVTNLQKEVAQHDGAVVDAVNELLVVLEKSRGLSPKEINAILCGTFDGGKKECAKPYANVSRWLRGEIETLEKKAAEFAKKKGEQVEVTVDAFLDPVLGKRKALHIEGYDTLPAGELRPIDRYGVRLNPQERERLAMEIKQAEAAALAINERRESGKNIKEKSRELLDAVQDNLRFLAEALKEPEKWKKLFQDAIDKLDALAKDPGTAGDVKNAADKLREDLSKFKANIEVIAEALTQIGSLKQYLSLETVLLGQAGLLDALGKLQTNLPSVGKSLGDITKDIENLVQKIPSQQAKALLVGEVKDFLEPLIGPFDKQYPATKDAIKILVLNLNMSIGTDTIAQTKTELIPHALDDLPDARLELARAGLTLNDRVTVKVRFKEKDADSTKGKGKTLDEATYATEVTLMGLHRVISADLIFARATSGSEDAKKWKPNVAALVNWHYTIREGAAKSSSQGNQRSSVEGEPGVPREAKSGNFWTKSWNWLNLGAGIHLANLDQGPDNVEFGVGGNLSLWEGLVSGGYGYNLSTKGKYFFIGINLFDVLNRAVRASQ
jgi:cytochrome c556